MEKMEDDSERFNSFVDSDSEDMSKDSLDYKSIKIKVYEETVNSLINENKRLRQQLNSMQIEMKEQEEKFMQAINEASQKIEEKKPINYSEKLQSYYEAFVQLDKENHILKLKVQELCEEIKLYKDECKCNGVKSTNKNDNVQNMIDEEIKTSSNFYDQNSLKPLSQNVINKKDEEIKELKCEIEQLKSENDMFKTMKNYIEEQNEKRASSVAFTHKLTTQQIEELNENIKHLEMEKSLLLKKLSSIEASLTRWIFRACDDKAELQKAINAYDELKNEFELLIGEKENLLKKCNELDKYNKDLEAKYDQEKSEFTKLELNKNKLESELENSKQKIQYLNENLEKLNFEIKNLNKKNDDLIKEHEKRSDEIINNLNLKIKNLNSINLKLENEKKLLDKDNETLKKSLNEIKRKIEQNEHENCDLKAKITKYDAEVYNIKDLKQMNEQLKSENQYFNKKIESLLTENNSIKKKFDSNLLEKNSIKCKYEEIIRELNDIKGKYDELLINYNVQQLEKQQKEVVSVLTQTPIMITNHSSIQTDDFNYELLFKPFCEEYEVKINDYIYKEQLYKKEIEQLKSKLSKHDNQFMLLNENLQIESKVNMDIRERNDFLFDKCEKLKIDINNQASEFLKFKVNHEIEKEVLETTINQQKKFIDYIVTTHPELGKKYKMFLSKR